MAEFRGLCKNVALLDLLISFSAVQRKKKQFVEGCSLEKQFFFSDNLSRNSFACK